MTKFLSDLLVKGILTADNGIVLGNGKNISTTNQAYLLATNYTNGIAVGWDVGAVYLGYSMGSLPIHIGSNGTGNVVLRSTGDTIIENGRLGVGTSTPSAKVHVVGGIYSTEGISFGGNVDYISPSSNSGFFTIASNQPIRFTNAAYTEYIRIAQTGNVGINTILDAGYRLDVNGSIRADGNGYFATNGTTTAPVIRFTPSNRVLVDPQGYGATTGATLDVGGHLSVNGYVTSANFHMVRGGSTLVGAPFISYGIGRPDANYSLTPLAGMGGYYAGTAWYNGAGLTFYTSFAADITGGTGLIEVIRVTPEGVMSVANLTGTGTRMVTASATGILGTTALPESLVVNNNNEYRIITGSATANTLNASSKLAWYNELGILYLEATASWGYGAEIDFDNRAINNTYWGLYGGDPSHPGMVMYRYLPSGKEITYWDMDRVNLASDVKLGFSSTGSALGDPDVALARESAGVAQINNGTTNSYASLKLLGLTATGDVNAANVVASAYVIANTMWVSGSYKNNNNGNMSLAFSGSTLQLTTDYGVSLSVAGNGSVSLPTLAGTGSRMVVANSSGTLSTQAIPTAITNYVTTDTTQTISGQKTFSALTTIFDSTATATFIEGKASGVLYGGISFSLFYQFNAYAAATQGFLWKNGLGSNVMALAQNGVLNLATLAGTGTRMVVTDANGNLGSQAVPTGSLQGAVDADKTTSGSLAVGTTIVKSVPSSYSGVFFDYVVKKGTNVRVGSVVAICNGTNVEFYETLSNDLGSTADLTFTVTLAATNINLNAVAASTGWTVIVSTRAI